MERRLGFQEEDGEYKARVSTSSSLGFLSVCIVVCVLLFHFISFMPLLFFLFERKKIILIFN